MRALSIAEAEVRIYPDESALMRAAAAEFLRAAQEAIDARKRFLTALAGGTTPRNLYALLVAEHKADPGRIPWGKIHVFFGDERDVPPTHSASNFKMARESLLSQVPLPSGNIHRIRTELNPRYAASDYEKWLRSFFFLHNGIFPRFDLILLGLGPDGHTASLFPDTAALNDKSRFVAENWVPQLNSFRVTFTYPMLNAAAEVAFLVSGREKAAVLRCVLRGDPAAQPLPAQQVRPASGRLLWLVDEAAANELG